MDYLMNIDHMLLIYAAVALTLILLICIGFFIRLRSQMIETRKLNEKIDSMIEDVLKVGDLSDYGVRGMTFGERSKHEGKNDRKNTARISSRM